MAALSLIVGTAAALGGHPADPLRGGRLERAAAAARRLAGYRGGGRSQGGPDRAELTGQMMDRLGLLMPRLAAVSPGADHAAAALLNDLRVGLNVIGLQRYVSSLPQPAQHDIAAVLAGIAAHYRGNPLRRHARIPAASPSMRRSRRSPQRRSAHRQVLMMLSGLRSLLFAGGTAARDRAIGGRAHEADRMIGEINLFGVLLPPFWSGSAQHCSSRRPCAGCWPKPVLTASSGTGHYSTSLCWSP